LQNLARLMDDPRVSVHVGSVQDGSLLEPLVAEADIVFHLAASVGVQKILCDPIEAMENNLFGTSAVLNAAANHGTKVVIASSSEVYGKRSTVPLGEDDDSVFGSTTKTRWSYAYCKAIDEFLALAYCRDRGVPVVVVRYFNVVGPRQRARYGMVVPRFVRQALAGTPLTVYGDGRQTRSFTDCTDAAGCTYALGMHPQAVGGVFNVGNDREMTILQLAERVKALTRSTSPLTFVPYDEAYGEGYEDLPRRVADISRAAALVGYRPQVTLDRTLRAIIAYERGDASRTFETPSIALQRPADVPDVALSVSVS
jgi:UDP-glucose 4-epimerase